jgi:hypothetical protein
LTHIKHRSQAGISDRLVFEDRRLAFLFLRYPFDRLAFIVWQFVLHFRRFLIDERARLVDVSVVRVMMLPLPRTACSVEICQNSHGVLPSADGAGLDADNAEALHEIVGSTH